MEEKGTIGIPRALMFYRYFPLWKVFFETLGWKVILSHGLGRRGNPLYFEDSCLPMKLLVTHALTLKDQVDYLFVPRLVSLHRSYIMCPKFRGAPDVVRLATDETVPLLDEVVDLRTKGHSMLASLVKTGGRLGADEGECRRAFQKAEASFLTLMRNWEFRINRLSLQQIFDPETPSPASEREKAFRVALIGHPYNLYDPDVNKNLLSLTRALGMWMVPSETLSEKEIDSHLTDLSKEIYWSSGREIAGSLFHFLSEGVDGILFLTSFKCGIDALLQEFVRRKLKIDGGSTPLLILSFDEHSGREGVVTRLEAFRDVMEERKSDRRIVKSS